MPWYRGNFHCHSTNSDGHEPPAVVASYYRSIGMDFVSISDHNSLTDIAEYGDVVNADFPAVPSCEYTGTKSCHVVGVDVRSSVAPADDQSSWTPAVILQDGVSRIHAAGGVPVLCHPAWNWAYGAAEILSIPEATHFEVFNASPDCNSYPAFGRSAPEQIWDEVLTAGRRIFGVASDDAHWHAGPAEARTLPTHLMGGGLGWCVVNAAERTRPAIRAAFEAGRFYASTGVELETYRVTQSGIDVAVRAWSRERTAIEFVGSGGATLARVDGLSGRYRFAGGEGYVRIRIADTTGCFALTQPVWLDSLEESIAWTRA